MVRGPSGSSGSRSNRCPRIREEGVVAVSSGERLIGVEWVLVTLLQAGDAIASGGQTTTNSQGVSVTAPKLPSPSRFFAAMIAYLMLAGAAMFGPNAAKVASRLGAVAALAI